jgi:photosystem II stability/assembly factor-like uncharacterized protein
MESVLYIGTDQGVLTARSQDQRSWKIVEHGLKKWEVPEVAVSPEAPNKVFAGTRGDGVWVSEDFGKSWKKPCYGKRGPGKVRAVTIDPSNPHRIYAGCEPIDVWVSEDEAKSWTRFDAIWDIPFIATVPYPVATVEPHVRDVTIDPTDPKVIYASLQVGYIVKSTDGGKSWTILDKNLDCDVHTIVVDPSNPKHIVVSTGGHDYRKGLAPGRALYVSEDAGNNWAPVAMNFSQEYSVPMTADPRNPKLLYSALASGQPGQWRRRDSGAEAFLIRSKDGGKSWTQHNKGILTKDYPEVILVDEKNAGRLYTACRNGDFFTSEDSGDNWQSMSLGLKVADLSSVALAHV